MATWTELRKHVWKPLCTLAQDASPIAEGIYRVGTAYLMTVPYFQDMTPSAEPIVSLVIWAPSVGALKRAFAFGIEDDDGATGTPPQEMLLAPSATTWATIRETGKAKGENFLESASYRIMTDGKFIHKQLEFRNYRAYFRSRNDIPNECPYAIAVGA